MNLVNNFVINDFPKKRLLIATKRRIEMTSFHT